MRTHSESFIAVQLSSRVCLMALLTTGSVTDFSRIVVIPRALASAVCVLSENPLITSAR